MIQVSIPIVTRVVGTVFLSQPACSSSELSRCCSCSSCTGVAKLFQSCLINSVLCTTYVSLSLSLQTNDRNLDCKTLFTFTSLMSESSIVPLQVKRRPSAMKPYKHLPSSFAFRIIYCQHAGIQIRMLTAASLGSSTLYGICRSFSPIC
jgi:hypothetical protein